MSITIFHDPQPPSDETHQHGKKLYSCLIKNRFRLNLDGSSKETYHLELDLSSLNLTYKEGSSIAIYPENSVSMVDRILFLLKLDANLIIHDKKSLQSYVIKDYLLRKANISRISSTLLSHFASSIHEKKAVALLEMLFKDSEKKHLFIHKHDLLSFLEAFPSSIDPQLLCDTLPPLLPRFYSIASSSKKHPNEIHLVIACFTHNKGSHIRHGVGSEYLCKTATIHKTPVHFYLQENLQFTLPSDPSVPIIMIGPGTGVAPFRAFIQNRILAPITTKNWLFFGERNQRFDFYYKSEFLDVISKGYLKLDTAFSRDQSDKVYVQHKILHHQKEIWQWMQDGAVIYICGDAKKMSKDVENAFVSIIQNNLAISVAESQSYLKTLKKNKRFLLDIY